MRAQQFVGAVEIAEHLLVGDAAGGAHLGADVFRRAMAIAEIQIGRDRRVAMMGEAAGAFAIPFIPAGRMMDQDHAGKRSGAKRAGHVSVDGFAFMPLHGHGFGDHAFILIGLIHRLLLLK